MLMEADSNDSSNSKTILDLSGNSAIVDPKCTVGDGSDYYVHVKEMMNLAMKSHELIPQVVKVLLETMKSKVFQDSDSEAALYFVYDDLPNFLIHLLSAKMSSISPVEVQSFCSTYLEHIISNKFQVALEHVEDHPEWIKNIFKSFLVLFSKETKFYLKFGLYSQDQDQFYQDLKVFSLDSKILDWREDYKAFIYCIPRASFSHYFVNTINLFGRLGGINVLLDVFHHENSPLLIEDTLILHSKLFSVFHHQLVKDLRNEILNRLFHYLRECNQFKTATKFYIQMIDSFFQSISNIDEPNTSTTESQDICKLELGKSLLKCDIVEKRIDGISILKSFVEDGLSSKVQQLPKHITTWITENDIFPFLFTICTHPLVLKKAKLLIIYLSKHVPINESNSNLIWSSCHEKHEALQLIIFDIIVGISPNLSLKMTNNFFRKFETLKLKELKPYMVTFIKNFVSQAVKNHRKNKEWPILSLLWKLSHVEFSRSEMNKVLLDSLKELLRLTELYHYRSIFISLCIDNLKLKRGVVPAMILLRSIFESYSPSLKNFNYSIIEKIDDKYQLMKITVETLQSVMKSPKITKENLNEIVMKDLTTTISSSRLYSVKEEIDTTLSFISFLLINSRIMLSANLCNLLWQTLYVECEEMYPKVAVMKWFESARSVKQYERKLISQAVSKSFFHTLRKTVPAQDYNHDLFSLFFNYFIDVNEILKRIFIHYEIREERIIEQNVSTNDKNTGWSSKISNWITGKRESKMVPVERKKKIYRARGVIVQDYKLVGIPFLWQIVHDCDDDGVVMKCIELLNDLRNNYARYLGENDGSVRKKHVMQCLEKLKDSLPEGKVGKMKKIRFVERLLIILLDFIFEYDAFLKRHGEATLPEHRPVTLSVHVNEETFFLHFSASDSVDRVFTRISHYLKVPLSFLKFYDYSGSEITPLEKKLISNCEYLVHKSELTVKILDFYDLGMDLIMNTMDFLGLNGVSKVLKQRNTIVATNTRIVLENSKVPEGDLSAPEIYLSKSDFLQQAFEILTLNESIASKGWLILMNLPTDQNILDQLKDGVSTELLTSLFDDSIYATSYYLQVIHVFQNNDPIRYQAWISQFKQKDGISYLVKFLEKQKETFFTGKIKSVCFSFLLKFINSMFQELNENMKSSLKEQVLPLMKVMVQTDGKIPIVSTNRSIHGTIVRSKKNLFSESNAIKTLDLSSVEKEIINEKFTFIEHLRKWKIPNICLHHHVQEFLDQGLLIDRDFSNETRNVFEDLGFGFALISMVERETNDFDIDLFFYLFNKIEIIERGDLSAYQSYFECLSSLIRILCKKGKFTLGAKLLEQLSQKISTHRSSEIRSSSSPDTFLIGLLNLIQSILHYDKSMKQGNYDKIMTDVFDNCLFKISADHETFPLCKSIESRRAAFDLLLELNEVSPKKSKHLFCLVKRNIEKSLWCDSWEYNPKGLQISELGLVGLKNLGATCYMNSILQQLYMTIPFRNSLLNIPAPPKSENPLLYEFQKMFVYLSNSEKLYYDPTPFTKMWKNPDGTEVDVSKQQDVNEFFDFFMDRIESELKEFGQNKDLFKEIFGGCLVNEVKYFYDDKEYTTETEEPFRVIGLEVQNKNSIVDSLTMLTEAQSLHGDNKYYSEQFRTFVDAQRRTAFKKLPNVLMFQLKRFDVDYNRMSYVKLNDRVEFPLVLNMEPFTSKFLSKETVERETKVYKLVGAIVHRGGANSGHYYSFISDRNQNWYEFNDCSVSKFDITNLDKAAFGGFEEVEINEPGKPLQRKSYVRTNNAYMLFYQRVNMNEEVPETKTGDTSRDYFINKVKEQNEILLRQQHIYDQEFDDYLWKLYQISDNTFAEFETIARYALCILTHSYRNEKNFARWTEMCLSTISSHPEYAIKIIQIIIENDLWRDLLFLCPIQRIREIFGRFANILLSRFLAENVNKEENLTPDCKEKPTENNCFNNSFTAENVFDSLQQVQSLVKSYPKRSFEYFSLIHCFVKKSYSCRKKMISQGSISEIIKILQDESEESETRNVQNLYEFPEAVIHVVLEILSFLVCSCGTIATIKSKGTLPKTYISNPLDEQIFLPNEDRNKILNKPFFATIASLDVNTKALTQIVKHWSWESLAISTSFSELLLSHIDEKSVFLSAPNHIPVFLQIIEALMVSLDDSIHEERTERILDQILLQISLVKKKSISAILITFVNRLKEEVPLVLRLMNSIDRREFMKSGGPR